MTEIRHDDFDPVKYSNPENMLRVGTLLKGMYQIGRVLGYGNFGITYLAYDTCLLRRVAIKEFFLSDYVKRNTPDSNDVLPRNEKFQKLYEERKAKFHQEAGFMSATGNTDISVKIYDYFEENNTAYIVMEYIQGENLENYLSDKGRLSLQETMDIILPLAGSLSIIHKRSIIHRDIKPGNIIITSDNSIRLLDFGSAKEYTEENDANTMLVFTENYAAIEQRSIFAQKGPWTDVYGLCAVMYRCLVGENPESADDRSFRDDPDKELIRKITEAAGNDKAELAEVIAKGMALDAEDRYQDMQELISELVPAVKGRSFIGEIAGRIRKAVTGIRTFGRKKIRKIGVKKLALTGSATVLVLALAIFLCVHFIGQYTKKDINSLGDGQIVYLNAEEGFSSDEVDDAFEIIRGRLDKLCGKKKYVLNVDGNRGELFVPYECFDGALPQKVLERFVLRPGRVFLAYDFFNYMELKSEGIESVSADEKNITLKLTDGQAEEVINSVEQWNTLKTKIDGQRATYCEIETAEDLSMDNIEGKDGQTDELRISFDYNLVSDGSLGRDTAYFGVSAISDDGKIINLNYRNMDMSGWIEEPGDTEGSACESKVIRDLIAYDFTGGHFDRTFNLSFGAPVIWEREGDKGDKNVKWGDNQVNPDYFVKQKTEAVDAIFEFRENANTSITAGYGLWLDNRNRLASELDEAGVTYSLGTSVDGSRSIAVRLANDTSGECYFNLLSSGVNGGYLGIRGHRDSDSNKEYSFFNPISCSDFEKNGVSLDNGLVTVKILECDDHNEFDEILYGDVEELKNGDPVIFNLMDSYGDHLLGTYDMDNSRLIFDESTFTVDGSIPEAFRDYVSLLNVLQERAMDGQKDYLENYSFAKSIPVYVSVDDALREHAAGLRDVQTDEKEKVLAGEIANMLGTMPEVRISSYDVCVVELFQNPGEHYAENLNRILEMTVSICRDKMKDVFDSNNGSFYFNIRNLDGGNQVRIEMNAGEHPVADISYWDYLLNESDRSILEPQLLKLKETMQTSPAFESYEVRLLKYYECGIRDNTKIFED